MASGNQNINIGEQKQPKCCSFCREPGHNIKNCNDDRLLEFEYKCSVKVHNSMNLLDFTFWISDEYSNDKHLLKSYAVKKGLLKIKQRPIVMECCEVISRYICEIYKPMFLLDGGNVDVSLESMILELAGHFGNNSESSVVMPQFEMEDNINASRVMFELLMYNMFKHSSNKLPAIYNISLNIENDEDVEKENKNKKIDDLCECGVCLNNIGFNDFIRFECNHQFCKSCVVQMINTKKDTDNPPNCPYCRAEILNLICKTTEVRDQIRNDVF